MLKVSMSDLPRKEGGVNKKVKKVKKLKKKKVKKIKKVKEEQTEKEEIPENETKGERRKRKRKEYRERKRAEKNGSYDSLDKPESPKEPKEESTGAADPRVKGTIGTKKGKELYLLADEQQTSIEAFQIYSSSGTHPTNIIDNHPEVIKAIVNMNYNEINALRFFLDQLYTRFYRSALNQGVIG